MPTKAFLNALAYDARHAVADPMPGPSRHGRKSEKRLAHKRDRQGAKAVLREACDADLAGE